MSSIFFTALFDRLPIDDDFSRPGEVSVKAVPSMAEFRGNTQKDQLWAAAFHSLITGEKLPQEEVDEFKSNIPDPVRPKGRQGGRKSIDSDASGLTQDDVPRAYRPQEVFALNFNSQNMEEAYLEIIFSTKIESFF